VIQRAKVNCHALPLFPRPPEPRLPIQRTVLTVAVELHQRRLAPLVIGRAGRATIQLPLTAVGNFLRTVLAVNRRLTLAGGSIADAQEISSCGGELGGGRGWGESSLRGREEAVASCCAWGGKPSGHGDVSLIMGPLAVWSGAVTFVSARGRGTLSLSAMTL